MSSPCNTPDKRFPENSEPVADSDPVLNALFAAVKKAPEAGSLRCQCTCANNPCCQELIDVPVKDRGDEALIDALWEHGRWITDAYTGEHYCPECASELFDEEEDWE